MQCYKVNGKLSRFEKATCGVPQGSCLGPLLFILYINDLPLSLKHSQVNMYADGTSISFSADSIPVINERVNEDLDSLKTWLAANKFSLNVAKTHILIIGSGQKLKSIQQATAVKPSLVIGTETISMIRNTKYLGVYVDQHLSWDVQIATMVRNISKALGMLRYSKQYLPIKSVQTMYKSLVEPYFRYCCPVWGVCGITALDKLQNYKIVQPE